MDVRKHNSIKVKCQCQSEIEVKFLMNQDMIMDDSKFANSDKTQECLMDMEGTGLEEDKLCGKRSGVFNADNSQSFTVPCEQSSIADSISRMEINNAEMGQKFPLLGQKNEQKNLETTIKENQHWLYRNLKENWKVAVGAVAIVVIITILLLIYLSNPPDTPSVTTSSAALTSLNASTSENKSTNQGPLTYSTQSTDLLLESKYEGTLLIIAGGEENGRLVNTVELFPPHFKSCLPDLPEEIKWGSLHMLENSLLVCGGQNRAEQPVKSCWILDKNNSGNVEWKHHVDLIRARSQFASAVVGDGSVLSILSGYSPIEEGWGIPSMQIVKLDGPGEEHKLTIPGARGKPYSARMASAVALSTKQILVTGGKGMEKDVFLISGPELKDWERQKGLNHGRFCHSSIVTVLDGSENVLVAGGWNEKGRALKSVELFSVKQNQWQFLQPLPSPRVDFTLQVLNSKIAAIGGYYYTDSTRIYPGVVAMTLSASGNLTFSSKGENQKERNGFMATQVHISWLQQLCST